MGVSYCYYTTKSRGHSSWRFVIRARQIEREALLGRRV